MKTIYIFSGLGTDERVFKDIDLTGYNAVFIKWIAPEKNESIELYARRLCQQITEHGPVLIGLSFGGIMAVEVCKHVKIEKVILISSAKTSDEIPLYFKMGRIFPFYKIVPTNGLLSSNFFSNWAFGITSSKDKRLLNTILKDTDPAFLRWALNAIVNWKNKVSCPNVVHIHGRSDRIFPYRFVKADISINKGGHFMIVDKSEELTRTIRSLLDSY